MARYLLGSRVKFLIDQQIFLHVLKNQADCRSFKRLPSESICHAETVVPVRIAESDPPQIEAEGVIHLKAADPVTGSGRHMTILATPEAQRSADTKLIEAVFPEPHLRASRPDPISLMRERLP